MKNFGDLLLTLFFYLVVTPWAFFLRLLKLSPLKLFERDGSYWVKKKKLRRDKSYYRSIR